MMEFKTLDAIKKMATERNNSALATKVLALQTSDKFRVAAELLDAGKPDVAEAVGMRACQEIKLSKLFGAPEGQP